MLQWKNQLFLSEEMASENWETILPQLMEYLPEHEFQK
jgi:hypothetical protein